MLTLFVIAVPIVAYAREHGLRGCCGEAVWHLPGAIVVISMCLLVAGLVHHLGEQMAFSEHWKRSEERRVGKECRSRWSAYH